MTRGCMKVKQVNPWAVLIAITNGIIVQQSACSDELLCIFAYIQFPITKLKHKGSAPSKWLQCLIKLSEQPS